MPKTVKTSTAKVIIDFIILIIVAIPMFIAYFVLTPFRRGFFCDDESIAYPYKTSTVTSAVMFAVGMFLPIAVFIVAELYIFKLRLQDRDLDWHSKFSYLVCGKKVHPYFVSTYKHLGTFLFGAAVNQSITEVSKRVLGRLRPHFLAVCKPDWSQFNCTGANELYRYVEDYECSGDPKVINEARLSHPSGHASFAAYCFVFLLFYLQHRMTLKSSKLLRHMLQVILIYMIIFVGFSRITDYMHHTTDVLSGLILGSSVAIVLVFFVTDYFKKPSLNQLSKQLDLMIRYADKDSAIPLEPKHRPELNNGGGSPSTYASTA